MGPCKIGTLRGCILDMSHLFRQQHFEAETLSTRPIVTGQILTGAFEHF